jgi:hypothetical protein
MTKRLIIALTIGIACFSPVVSYATDRRNTADRVEKISYHSEPKSLAELMTSNAGTAVGVVAGICLAVKYFRSLLEERRLSPSDVGIERVILEPLCIAVMCSFVGKIFDDAKSTQCVNS